MNRIVLFSVLLLLSSCVSEKTEEHFDPQPGGIAPALEHSEEMTCSK